MAVLEVGIGGRLDATNVVPPPAACGITSLGFDHMELLGDTLEVRAVDTLHWSGGMVLEGLGWGFKGFKSQCCSYHHLSGL